MWRHFDAAAAVNEAVIDGDLVAARGAAQWLAERGGTDPPISGADGLVNQMRRHAQEVAAAADLSEAALGAAAMARTCGECHLAFGPGPTYRGSGVPPLSNDDVRLEMRRHVWASSRMWEGLIGPSDAAWIAGARVFQEASFDTNLMAVPEADRDAVRTMSSHLHDMGRVASGATDTGVRANLYAELIGTCAECHSIVGR
jgi:cytochrome c553